MFSFKEKVCVCACVCWWLMHVWEQLAVDSLRCHSARAIHSLWIQNHLQAWN